MTISINQPKIHHETRKEKTSTFLQVSSFAIPGPNPEQIFDASIPYRKQRRDICTYNMTSATIKLHFEKKKTRFNIQLKDKWRLPWRKLW